MSETTNDPLIAPRKAPSQARARATYERILKGTREILRDRGAEAVNTRSIAEVSGVRTGSIYQYFPNKESILYTLYGRRMEQTVEAVEQALTDEVLAKSFDETWNTLLKAIKGVGWGSDEDVALDKAMGEAPALREAVAPELKSVYGLLTRVMRHYGSDWPDQALYDLSEYIFSLNHFGYATRIRQDRRRAKITAALTDELESYLMKTAITVPYKETDLL